MRSTLLYVVSVAGPALLLVIAVDVLRSRHVRVLETIAWIVTAGALLVALVYPSLLVDVGALIGITVPVAVAGFIGIAGLFVGYMLQRDRVAALESRVRRLEGEASADVVAGTATDQPAETRSAQGKVSLRGGDGAHAS
jgi:hypothetical protein